MFPGINLVSSAQEIFLPANCYINTQKKYALSKIELIANYRLTYIQCLINNKARLGIMFQFAFIS